MAVGDRRDDGHLADDAAQIGRALDGGVLHRDAGQRALRQVLARTQITGHDARLVAAGVDAGAVEDDILQRAVQDTGEAGVGHGICNGEAGNGLPVAVEMDELVEAPFVVERSPLGAGNVHILNHFEVLGLAADEVAADGAERGRVGDEPRRFGRAFAARIVAGARPAGGVQDDGVHLAGQEGSLRREGNATLPVVAAISHDRDRQDGAGRDLDFLPGQGHPGGEHVVFTQGDFLQVQAEGRGLGAGIVGIKHRLVGTDGHAFRRGDAFRQGEGELEHAALLEGAFVLCGPGVAEFEGFERIDPGEERAVRKVVHRPVAGLDLAGPGSRLQLRHGTVGAGIQDGEGGAGHRLAGEVGLVGREAVLDVKDGRVHAGDKDLVPLFPLPGEAGFRGGRGDAGRRAVGNGRRNGHEAVFRNGNGFHGLVAGEQERKKGRRQD